MMFGVIFKVIGSNLEEKADFPKTFCIGKRRREMMFGVIFKVIGSNLEENWFLADFGQKA